MKTEKISMNSENESTELIKEAWSKEELAEMINERVSKEMVLDYLMHPPKLSNMHRKVRDAFDTREVFRDILMEAGIENVKLMRKHESTDAFGKNQLEAVEIFDLQKFRESDDFSEGQSVCISQRFQVPADVRREKVSIDRIAKDLYTGEYSLFVEGNTAEQNQALQLRLSCGRISREVKYGWDKD